MTRAYDIECSPARSEWEGLLKRNSAILSSLFLSYPAFNSAREMLRAEAKRYDSQLRERATAIGVPYPEYQEGNGALIGCGHQPVSVHSGLYEKYRQLNFFAAESDTDGVNFVLDTDAGGVDLLFSACGAAPRSLERIGHPLAGGHGWYGGQGVVLNESLEAFLQRAPVGLKEAGAVNAAEAFVQAARVIRGMDDWSIVDAQTFIRRVFHGAQAGGVLHYRDVPLQQVMQTDAAFAFAATFLFEAERLRSVYNQVLQQHRKDRNIKNPANPFPDLSMMNAGIETPFWLYQPLSGRRSHLLVRPDINGRVILTTAEEDSVEIEVTQETLHEVLRDCCNHHLIVPRAAFLSLLFRLLYTDFFIHGRGGARYDECTNAFMKAWFSIEPPSFATVSADRYLFPEIKDRQDSIEELRKNLRDIIFHPEQYRDHGLLSEEDVQVIKGVKERKESKVALLKDLKKQGESVAHLTQEIKTLDAEVKSIVEQAFERYAGDYTSLSDTAIQAIGERTYPFFLFFQSDELPFQDVS